MDLRLDHRFRVFNNNSVTHLDLSGNKAELEHSINRVMSRPIALREDEAFLFTLVELVLGATFGIGIYPRRPRRLALKGAARWRV